MEPIQRRGKRRRKESEEEAGAPGRKRRAVWTSPSRQPVPIATAVAEALQRESEKERESAKGQAKETEAPGEGTEKEGQRAAVQVGGCERQQHWVGPLLLQDSQVVAVVDGRYRVSLLVRKSLSDVSGTDCSCPAGGPSPCSHVAAVTERLLEGPEAVLRMSAVREAVQQMDVAKARRLLLEAVQMSPEVGLGVVPASVAGSTDLRQSSEHLFLQVCAGESSAMRALKKTKDGKESSKMRMEMLMQDGMWQEALHYARTIGRKECLVHVPLILAKLGQYDEALAESEKEHKKRCGAALLVFEEMVEAGVEDVALVLGRQILQADQQAAAGRRITQKQRDHVAECMLEMGKSLGLEEDVISLLQGHAVGLTVQLAEKAMSVGCSTKQILVLMRQFVDSGMNLDDYKVLCRALCSLKPEGGDQALVIDLVQAMAAKAEKGHEHLLLDMMDILSSGPEVDQSHRRLLSFCAFFFAEKLALPADEATPPVWEPSHPRSQLMQATVAKTMAVLEAVAYDVTLCKRTLVLIRKAVGVNYAVLLKWLRRLFNKLSSGVADFSASLRLVAQAKASMNLEDLRQLADSLMASSSVEALRTKAEVLQAIAEAKASLENRAACIQAVHEEALRSRQELLQMSNNTQIRLRIPSRLVVGFENFLKVVSATRAVAPVRTPVAMAVLAASNR